MKEGWQTKKLRQLCEIELGKTPARANKAFWDQRRETGNVWLSIADLLDAQDKIALDSKEYLSDKGAAISKIVRKGTLLASFKLTLGRLAFAGRDLFTNEAIAALPVFNEQELSKEFLFYFLSFFDWDKATEGDVKIKGKTLNKAKLKEMGVHFPVLPEQRRIVGILDEAFEGIATAKANAKKNLQNARALFESHLQSVFTQRGRTWTDKELGEMCERITKGSSPRWQGIAYVDKPGVLFVTSENVGEYEIRLNEPKYVEEKFNAKDKKSILKRGDVLTNIVGASIGRTAVFDRGDLANINQAVCLIRCEPGQLNGWFLTYLLNSPVFKDVLHDNEVDNARANLSLSFFSHLRVPTPPLSEQAKIVDALDSMREQTQRLASLYQRKLAALDALKKSLLHQAFSGQL